MKRLCETILTALRHRCLIFLKKTMLLAALCGVASGADFTFEIPPAPASLNIAGQAVTITVSGNISGAPAGKGERDESLNLSLRADLTDFQKHLTPLLQEELNQSNRCGERVSVENATLVPAVPAGHLTVQLHFEKWVCVKAFGKENAKRLVGGNGTVQLLLTPRVEEGNAVRLDAEIGDIDADGSLGDLLRSEYGATLRGKIREALLKAVQKSTSLETVVPAQARSFVMIQSIAFADGGSGFTALNLTARILVPGEQVSSLLEQFRNRR